MDECAPDDPMSYARLLYERDIGGPATLRHFNSVCIIVPQWLLLGYNRAVGMDCHIISIFVPQHNISQSRAEIISRTTISQSAAITSINNFFIS